ncbi:hypothetical protein CABS01_05353, partial [Colletotrichum abscissum]|uniref:uncharacterized protein n=1 Tax=Colletotrichum abscissum TaxID=1671311 RepID=UPI0027D52ED4
RRSQLHHTPHHSDYPYTPPAFSHSPISTYLALPSFSTEEAWVESTGPSCVSLSDGSMQVGQPDSANCILFQVFIACVAQLWMVYRLAFLSRLWSDGRQISISREQEMTANFAVLVSGDVEWVRENSRRRQSHPRPVWMSDTCLVRLYGADPTPVDP